MATLYSEFLPDAKEMVADFGVPGSCNAGAITFQCLISDPVITQSFQEGGFVDRTQHMVRIPAATASWSLPDGLMGHRRPSSAGRTPSPPWALARSLPWTGRACASSARPTSARAPG